MVTVKLFTRFGCLLKVAHTPAIVAPDVVVFEGRHFIRDYYQGWEWQRYTEVNALTLEPELKP